MSTYSLGLEDFSLNGANSRRKTSRGAKGADTRETGANRVTAKLVQCEIGGREPGRVGSDSFSALLLFGSHLTCVSTANSLLFGVEKNKKKRKKNTQSGKYC